jgi:hypothetical protein
MLKIEVKRHSKREDYFEPWIERFDHGGGWRFHFHWDDISDEGVEAFREIYEQQSTCWRPRAADAPRGPHIPNKMERKAVLPDGEKVAVYDTPDGNLYMVRADLISERGARLMARAQWEISRHWERIPPEERTGE